MDMFQRSSCCFPVVYVKGQKGRVLSKPPLRFAADVSAIEVCIILGKFHRDQKPAGWSPQMVGFLGSGNLPKIPETFRFRNYSNLHQIIDWIGWILVFESMCLV